MQKTITIAIILMAMVASLTVSNVSRTEAAIAGLLDDSASHPPPSSGTYAYNTFVPNNVGGTSFSDPVFGTTIKRLSTDHAPDDSYARNMWWNADATKYLHRTVDNSVWDVIDSSSGQITHHAIPIGDDAADAGFDPIDPNVLFKYSGNTIKKVILGTNGTWTESVYFTAPATLKGLGGTINWLDATGKFMLVRYGSEPSVHLYDRQNLSTPYTNAIDGAITVDTNGYVGLSPDGNYVVGYTDVGGYNMGEGLSWKIDAVNKSVASAPNKFWSLCGDHGTFVSASDGRNYMVVTNCYDYPEIWRVDITNNAAGPLAVPAQKLLANNKKLLNLPDWNTGVHFSSVAKDAYKDWVFVSTEDGADTFNSSVSNWLVYKQEIIGINVLTGEVRRLAHHRSRGVSQDYYNTPRLTASWGGEYVAWNSNFNQSGQIDVYALSFGGSSAGTVTPPPPPVAPPPPPTVLPPPPPPAPSVDIVKPTIPQFNAQARNRKTTVSWQVRDSGGSHLKDVQINRASYSTNCNDKTKSGCAWVKVKTVTAPSAADAWSSVTYDNPGKGTFYYGMRVSDNNSNAAYESNQIKMTSR